VGASIIAGAGGAAGAAVYAGEAGGVLALGVGGSGTIVPVIGTLQDLKASLGPDGQRAFETLGEYNPDVNLEVIKDIARWGISIRDVSIDATGNFMGAASRMITQERQALVDAGYGKGPVLNADGFWYWIKK
jgi:hypothetical protein